MIMLCFKAKSASPKEGETEEEEVHCSCCAASELSAVRLQGLASSVVPESTCNIITVMNSKFLRLSVSPKKWGARYSWVSLTSLKSLIFFSLVFLHTADNIIIFIESLNNASWRKQCSSGPTQCSRCKNYTSSLQRLFTLSISGSLLKWL